MQKLTVGYVLLIYFQDHYGPPEHGHSDSGFDGSKLKQDILNTIFQAVKAITGGVVGIGGQLIKGSGYLVSASGKLVSASGDQVTKVGQTVAKSAHLVPAKDGGKAAIFASLSSGLSKGSSGIASSVAGLSSGSSSKGASSDGHGSTGTYNTFNYLNPKLFFSFLLLSTFALGIIHYLSMPNT